MIDVRRLPPEIVMSTRAVVWNVQRRSGDKPTKVPYVPDRPEERAAVDDPATWGTFADAVAAVEDGKADGVGVVLGEGLSGVDLDRCRNSETGEIQESAMGIVRQLDSYTEISPSGTGLHVLLHGTLPPGRRRKGRVEMYEEGRYFTITGQHLEGTPTTIEVRTRELALLHGRIFGIDSQNENGHQPYVQHPVNLDEVALIRRAKAAKNGSTFSALWAGDTRQYDGDDSAADLALCNLLAFWTGCDASRIDRLFRQSALKRDKWDSRRGSQTYGEITIAKAIAGCTKTYETLDVTATVDAEVGATNHDDSESGTRSGVTLNDFYALMPMHAYLFEPTRDLWPASSVNARIGSVPIVDKKGNPVLDVGGQPKKVKASAWLDRHRPVEQMTWDPGSPSLIRDRLVSDGGWIERPGCTTFNLYRPPQIEPGEACQAGPWLEHLARVYPHDSTHILAYLAHRIQRSHEKINHALVLGGQQGIGKDTILEPVKAAVGPWNFVDVSPAHLLGRFNGFGRSVILRINEARDLGEINRYSFYEHLKIYTAAPPDVLRVDEKNLREYVVWNVCGVVITTNHKTDGLYLPPDDRRHYVAWSESTRDDFAADYWTELYAWYTSGGNRHVGAYLAEYDLSSFDAKAPPPRTAAFWDIVDANRAPEDAELADVLDTLEHPSATTLVELAGTPGAPLPFADWLRDRKTARQVPHRMEAAGYVRIRNPGTKSGLWIIKGRRQAVYVRRELSIRDQFAAARELTSANSDGSDCSDSRSQSPRTRLCIRKGKEGDPCE
jgi:hypothetical protein